MRYIRSYWYRYSVSMHFGKHNNTIFALSCIMHHINFAPRITVISFVKTINEILCQKLHSILVKHVSAQRSYNYFIELMGKCLMKQLRRKLENWHMVFVYCSDISKAQLTLFFDDTIKDIVLPRTSWPNGNVWFWSCVYPTNSCVGQVVKICKAMADN